MSKEGHDRADDSQILQAAMAHWIHEDNLYWAQIRYLVIVQLAAYGAWYATAPSFLAAMPLVLAMILSWHLSNLAKINPWHPRP